MKYGNGKPHRIPRKHNRKLFLEVLPGIGETPIKTITVRKRAIELYPEYTEASVKWFRDMLNELSIKNVVEKIRLEDDVADYWRTAQ
jgi:hypothetical protein